MNVLHSAINRISNDDEIHPSVVQRIQDSLDTTAVTSLNEKGIFRMSLPTARVRLRRAQKEAGGRVCGKEGTLKAKPERCKLFVGPTKLLREKCV